MNKNTNPRKTLHSVVRKSGGICVVFGLFTLTMWCASSAADNETAMWFHVLVGFALAAVGFLILDLTNEPIEVMPNCFTKNKNDFPLCIGCKDSPVCKSCILYERYEDDNDEE